MTPERIAALQQLVEELRFSLRIGLLFDCYDEPLGDHGKRIVRVIEQRLATLLTSAIAPPERDAHEEREATEFHSPQCGQWLCVYCGFEEDRHDPKRGPMTGHFFLARKCDCWQGQSPSSSIPGAPA